MAFQYGQATTTYGVISSYGISANGSVAQTVSVKTGSQIVFDNNDIFTDHTASGLGVSGFPANFDNSSGATPSGNTINSGTTWSTGNLNAGSESAAFTVGPPAVYYFGCAYHYTNPMRDVIISTK